MTTYYRLLGFEETLEASDEIGYFTHVPHPNDAPVWEKGSCGCPKPDTGYARTGRTLAQARDAKLTEIVLGHQPDLSVLYARRMMGQSFERTNRPQIEAIQKTTEQLLRGSKAREKQCTQLEQEVNNLRKRVEFLEHEYVARVPIYRPLVIGEIIIEGDELQYAAGKPWNKVGRQYNITYPGATCRDGINYRRIL